MANNARSKILLNNIFRFLIINCLLSLGFATDNFAKDCLAAHNKYRKKHGTPDLELDEETQNIAQEYANKLASGEASGHSNRKGYGENLYTSFGMSVSAEAAVKAWYDEIKDYNFNKPGFSGNTGHFTQVIWKSSKKLGCAFAQKGTEVHVVANYVPAGNMLGAFPENVPKGSHSGATVGKILMNPRIFIACIFSANRLLQRRVINDGAPF